MVVACSTNVVKHVKLVTCSDITRTFVGVVILKRPFIWMLEDGVAITSSLTCSYWALKHGQNYDGLRMCRFFRCPPYFTARGRGGEERERERKRGEGSGREGKREEEREREGKGAEERRRERKRGEGSGREGKGGKERGREWKRGEREGKGVEGGYE